MGLNIGDLLLRAVVDDKGFEADLVKKTGKAGDKAGTTLGARLTGGFKKAGAGLTDGLKLGAGIAAFGALDTAISATIGFLGDAVAAARADEESQNRLAASLRANIAGWDGNTDAIEANILAKQRLGFDDETLRDSLTVLAGATHDVTKATEIQNTAMDLARFKGIDLKTASEALIKVEGGQYRSLKQLGIKLRDGATATEALAAVQKVAKGQAEAYAKTNEGKLTASQIELSEKMEKLGGVIMPLVTKAMLGLADAAGPVVDAVADLVQAVLDADNALAELKFSSDEAAESSDLLGSKTTPLGKAIHALADGITTLVNQEQDLLDGGARVADMMRLDGAAMAGFSGAAGEAALGIGGASKKIVDDIGTIPRATRRAQTSVKDSLTAIVTYFNDMQASLEGAASGAAGAIYDPIIAKQEYAATQRDLVETQAAIKSKKLKGEELADAQLHLTELQKTQIEQLATLAAYGDESAATTLKTMIATLKATKDLSVSQRAQLKLLELALDRVRVTALNMNTALGQGRNQGGGFGGGKAAGGPVTAGRSYVVGEYRPELFVPETNGRIIPRVPATPSPGGAPNRPNVTVNVEGLVKAKDPLAIARQLQRFADAGYLDGRDEEIA